MIQRADTRLVLARIIHHNYLLWFAAAFLIVAGIFEFTDEFLDGSEPNTFDVFILNEVAAMRSPLATVFFVNFTALGSATLITLHTIIAFALLASTGDKTGAWQLAGAAAGALLLTEWTKAFIERPRPTVIPPLVDALGYSYPSGHSLAAAAMYVTLAILAMRHLRLFRQRVVLMIITTIIVLGVGVSRIYLGVHYPTDVFSGICLGVAWAMTLAGIVSFLEHRSAKRTRQSG